MKVDLKSSVQKQGKTVTQIVTALSGIKKTFRGIKTETIEQGQFTHFDTEDGRLVLINDKNIAWIEVFTEEMSQTQGITNPYGDTLKHKGTVEVGDIFCNAIDCPICNAKI